MFVSDASILRISEEKTLELVELYKQEQCLWDTNSRDYRIKMKRREAAEKIARILDLPNFKARHVMMKFKNLRNAYCQELKKIAIAQNLGSEEDAVPRKSKQRAQWYAVMDSFIRPHLQANYSYSGPTLVSFFDFITSKQPTADSPALLFLYPRGTMHFSGDKKLPMCYSRL